MTEEVLTEEMIVRIKKLEELRKLADSGFKKLQKVPCNFKGCELWSDCKICNGLKLDKTQPAFKCPAWYPETLFGDCDP